MAPPPRLRLDEAIDGIFDGVVAMLQEERETPGGLLDDVASLVASHRARPVPEPPSLWVFLGEALNEHPPKTMHETWTQQVILTCVAKADEPETGSRQAQSICARGRSTVLKRWKAYVRANGLAYIADFRSVSFDPDAAEQDDRGLYTAAAVIAARFTILEEV